MPSDIKKILIVLLVIILGVQLWRNRTIDPYMLKGDEFSVRFPEGWIKAEDRTPIGVMLISEEGAPEVTAYYSPTKEFLKDQYHASISVIALKMHRSVWIDDEFVEIAAALGQAYRILDQGEYELQGRKSRWILYFDKRANLMVMEFYFADHTKWVFKLRYVAMPEKFNEYRPAFEAMKSSFKFRRGNPPEL